MAAPLFQNVFVKDVRRLSAHGRARCLQARRHFGVSCCLTAKVPPPRKPRERVEIPGLEMITYGEKMHYVPGLAKPIYAHWERDYKDPRYYKAPPACEMPLHKEKPCYVYHQRTSALEGVRQALWLTKTKPISGLPPQLLSLTESSANQIPDQDERVKNCVVVICIQPVVSDQDLFQVRGQSGLLHNCMDPLPEVCGKQEVSDTADHVLETFYPVSPTIDLQKVQVYKEELNCSGFREGYPYPHAHTLYFLEGADARCKLRPEQFRTKMLMFTFGNALARAQKLYGPILDRPITVQAVGTNGRIFQFLVFQLNTTNLAGDDGIKNQVWLEEDVELYDFAKVRPLIKKKQVKIPAGLAGYKPETFSKFLALYLHGAV
uniref:Large ribosomal subunit protein mL37 n=1 Tax=Mola mola TaxID=94237 RepID=A0A3Q3XRJ1_MOLML